MIKIQKLLLLPRSNVNGCLAWFDLVIIILSFVKRNKIRILYRFRFYSRSEPRFHRDSKLVYYHRLAFSKTAEYERNESIAFVKLVLDISFFFLRITFT